MGAAAGTVAAGASIGGSALNAFGSIARGYGEEASAEYQADKAKRSAEFGRLKAQTTDVVMREQLNTTLANIDVIRAAAHTDATSPTGAAVKSYNQRISDRQRTAALLSINQQIAQDEADAAYLREAGQFAVQLGYLGAASGFIGDVGKAIASNKKSA